jgi:hypothetical protein
MKLKSSIIFSLVMILLGNASARPVDEATARTVASHFFASQYNFPSESLRPQIAYAASPLRDGKGTTPSFYVVNFNNDGFVIVASAESQPVSALQVLDLFGKLLLHKNVGEREFSVDLSNYSAGTYILRLVTDKGIETRKIVKY